MIRKIPVIFRIPIALAIDAIIFFGPIGFALFFRDYFPIFREYVSVSVIIFIGIIWILICHKFFLWRLDSFWNIKSRQNKTLYPENPDNYRKFKTLKAWIFWNILGKEIEDKNDTKPVA